MTVETLTWRRTSPLAIVFFIGRILEHIAKNLTQTLAPVAAFLIAWEGNLVTKVAIAATAFAVIVSTVAFLRYWYFGYRISDQAIVIRDGVIKKTRLDLKFDRIQAINSEQNVIFRLFGLLTVKFDTAGSSGEEGYLPAIRTSLASELKTMLKGHHSEDASQLAGEGVLAPDDPAPRAVLRRSVGEIVRYGLSSNQAFIYLAFLAPFSQPIADRIEGLVDKQAILDVASSAAMFGLGQGAAIGIGLFIGIFIFVKTISVIGAVLRYHGYDLVADKRVLRAKGGLLTRHENSIGFAKIQTVNLNQGLILRLFRRYTLRARQAASSQRNRRRCFVIPIALPDELPGLAELLFRREFGGLDLDPASPSYRPISLLYFKSRLMVAGVIPAALAMVLAFPMLGWASLWVLAWVPASGLVFWGRYRRLGVLVTRDGLALRSGFIGYRLTAHLFRKVQRVSVTQSPLQRRKDMATLRLYLASGTVRVPYQDLEYARQLRDYVLFKAESSTQAWH